MSDETARVEGTFSVSGLLEGRLGGADPAGIRAWVDQQREVGLHFALEVEGASFSLLPSSVPVRAAALRPDPGVRLEAALTELLATLPAAARGETYSTLHSIEVRPDQEVQCVYAVSPAGTVRREERIRVVATKPPTPPPSPRTLGLRALAAVGILAIVVALSSLFVDWPSALRGLWHQVSALKSENLAIDAGDFAPYLVVERHDIGRESRSVVLALRRGPRWPATLDAEPTAATWRERLAKDAVGRGVVRAEIFDAAGAYVASADVRIAGLHADETVKVVVPLPRDPRPARIVFRP